jgi:photosystem II stability/assembly factor-like uncharacterized protein
MRKVILITILLLASFQASHAQWVRQKLNTLAWLKSIYFLNERKGWIVGGNGTYISTIDGGDTWKIRKLVNNETIHDVVFLDEKNGWLLCERNRYILKDKQPSYLLKTNDGGETWENYELNSGTGREVLLKLFFDKRKKGWAIGDLGSIFKMQETEKNWSKQKQPVSYRIQDGVFLDNSNGVLVGGGGTTLFTEDGGENWNPSSLSEPLKTKLNSLFFISKQTGWMVGAEGKIFTTNNGGKRWRSQNSNIKTNLNDVFFVSNSEGWAIGDEGKILRTINGGNTWSEVKNSLKHNLESICFTGKKGWIVGFGGTVFRYQK